jgi:hypothetical protein
LHQNTELKVIFYQFLPIKTIKNAINSLSLAVNFENIHSALAKAIELTFLIKFGCFNLKLSVSRLCQRQLI